MYSHNAHCNATGWRLLIVCMASSIFIRHASSTLTIPSTNIAYASLPALYYGKSWSSSTAAVQATMSSSDNITDSAINLEGEHGHEPITAYLQYFDIDYCTEFGKIEETQDAEHIYQRSPIKSYASRQQPSSIFDSRMNGTTTGTTTSYNGTDSDKYQEQMLQQQRQSLPVALLIHDQYGHGYIKSRPCHLIDYERLAIAWNVSYIIFYDGADVIDDASDPSSWYEHSQGYLDSPILSETNSIGFQLVSYSTGLELISLINDSETNENSGIVVQLDGRIKDPRDDSEGDISSSSSSWQQDESRLLPPRFSPAQIRFRKLLALVPMASGILSFLGSSYIVYSLVATKVGRKKKLRTTFHRLLLGLSVSDMISSFGTSLSQWVFPQQEFPGIDPVWHSYTYPYASGTNNTCSLQVSSL